MRELSDAERAELQEKIAEQDRKRIARGTASSGFAPTNVTFRHVLFSFDGRISRSTFWLRGVLPIIAISMATEFIKSEVETMTKTSSNSVLLIFSIISVLVFILVFWISLSVFLKRCHDRNHSFLWFLLIGLIPIVGQIWLMIELGFLKGTYGDNRYGTDPLR